jgi:hypothetical protein
MCGFTEGDRRILRGTVKGQVVVSLLHDGDVRTGTADSRSTDCFPGASAIRAILYAVLAREQGDDPDGIRQSSWRQWIVAKILSINTYHALLGVIRILGFHFLEWWPRT